MKRKKYTPDQIIAKLREADGLLASGGTIAQVCQRIEVSEQTVHRWRNQYGGVKANQTKLSLRLVHKLGQANATALSGRPVGWCQ